MFHMKGGFPVCMFMRKEIIVLICVVCQWRNSGELDTGQGERISPHSQTPTFPGHCPGDALSPRKWNAPQVSLVCRHVITYVAKQLLIVAICPLSLSLILQIHILVFEIAAMQRAPQLPVVGPLIPTIPNTSSAFVFLTYHDSPISVCKNFV